MNKAGRPRKPTALHIVAGNPGKRPLPKNEIKPDIEIPTMPRHLSAEGQAEWQRLAPVLFRLKLLSKLDRAAFAAYCQAWARHVEAEEMMAKTGAMAFTPNKFPIVNPWYTISKQSVEVMAKFLGAFGLTPSARAQINSPYSSARDGNADETKTAFTF